MGGATGLAGGGAVYNLSLDVGPVTATRTATVTVANSILANTAGGPDVENDQENGTATVSATGPNIISVAVANSGGAVMGTAFAVTDPKLTVPDEAEGFCVTKVLPSGLKNS